jgi:hypothetical protein
VKETAADTGKPAKGQFDAMCAPNCAQLASTRIGWANKAKEIAVDTARLVEVESKFSVFFPTRPQPSPAGAVSF